MFKIKFCGITTPEDALLAADAGADAIGLNFYEKSPRYVTQRRARAILSKVPKAITAVYVLVNASLKKLSGTVTSLPYRPPFFVQLHGNEPPEVVGELSTLVPDAIPLIRAFRCKDSSLDDVAAYLKSIRRMKFRLPKAILLDAYQARKYGGTGRVVDWVSVRDRRRLLQRHATSLILAGGLTPDNVAEAIRTARPDAVDVASGVESSTGKKDPAKVRDFIAAANEAFSAIED